MLGRKSGASIGVRAPAATLARMAWAVRVSPAELDAVGRSDAAGILRTLRAEDAHEVEIDLSAVPDEVIIAEAIERWQSVLRRLAATTGTPLPSKDALRAVEELAASRGVEESDEVRLTVRWRRRDENDQRQ